MDEEKKNSLLRDLYWVGVLGWIWEGIGNLVKINRPAANNEKQLDADNENGCCSIGCGIFLLLGGLVGGMGIFFGLAVWVLGVVLLIFGLKLYRRNRTGEHPKIDSAKKVAKALMLSGVLLLCIGVANDFIAFVFCGALGLPFLIIGMTGMWTGWK